ncbi:MAG: hypothetical protein ACD_21C00017G0004 [uncultured bacterium]|nr:MAG: hypothetical protein ACD_21C00017G0004 [uncultured bacterium]
MTKQRSFWGLTLALLFFVVPNLSFGKQIVYFAEDLKAVQAMKKLGAFKSCETIIQEAVRRGHLQEVTPEFAQEKFGIEWLETMVPTYLLTGRAPPERPRLIIVNMGAEVGYGLFAAETIKKDAIIAEYTGKVSTERSSISDSVYAVSFEGVDFVEEAKGKNFYMEINAKEAGNAARFAQHMPCEKEISKYLFIKPDIKERVALSNAFLGAGAFWEENVFIRFLQASEEISPFQQIGHSYGPIYYWSEAPHLFGREGGIIPRENYNVSNPTLILVADEGRIEVRVNSELKEKILDPSREEKEEFFPAKKANGTKIMFRVDREELSQRLKWPMVYIRISASILPGD